jgi:S-adenosylmethionine synthetase
MRIYEATSEAVAAGHPDKVADRISDEILDCFYKEGMAQGCPVEAVRVAVETLVTTDTVILAGEVSGPDIPHNRIDHTVREAIRDLGYDQPGFDWRTVRIENLLQAQSPDCARAVDAGAGDQGSMFGYATNETPNLMPAPLHYANRILRSLHGLRKLGFLPDLGPDGKSQVTLRYGDGKPVGAAHIVLSVQHAEGLTSGDVRKLVEPIIRVALPPAWITPDTVFHINPHGGFVHGGPAGDTGLTGRKNVVDTYGGAAPHGGGAFSGKDPTKVDRAGAYAARYLAKNVVGAGLAERCTVQISYAIGVAKPVSLFVDTHGTGSVSDDELERILPGIVDLTPEGIRRRLGLCRPIYARTAAYGHFGRLPDAEGGFSWEKTDLAEPLRGSVAELRKAA